MSAGDGNLGAGGQNRMARIRERYGMLRRRGEAIWARRYARLAIVLVAAAAVILFPYLFQPGSTFLFDLVEAVAFVVMALGLNVVVGFAGLLDLGYVAFFAIGAYTIGWFGSGFFVHVNHP